MRPSNFACAGQFVPSVSGLHDMPSISLAAKKNIGRSIKLVLRGFPSMGHPNSRALRVSALDAEIHAGDHSRPIAPDS